MAWVDLHLHSSVSDGFHRPSRLVTAALEHGLTALALTDHDTLGGLREADAAARGTPLLLVPGVELSVDLHGGGSAHLLGYFPGNPIPSWDGGSLETALTRIRESRSARNERILGRLREAGIPITMEDVTEISEEGVTGRLHIAMTLVRKGVVPSVSRAFDDYLGSGAPAYVARERLGDFAAIALIRENGGIPVLAHPGLLPGRAPAERHALLASLTDGGLMGLEVFYPLHDAAATRDLLRTAAGLNLLVTGGSDFHGEDGRPFPWKPGNFRVDEDDVGCFIARCREMKGALEHGKTQ